MRKVILHGYYSEYVLEPLEVLLSNNGFEVFVLNEDDNCIELDLLKEILQDGCIFISSCHFFGSNKIFCSIYPQLTNIYTPFDIFQIKSSKTKMIYIPHDLTEPIKWSEWPMAYIFDKILLPFHCQIPTPYKERCSVIGWAKNFLPPPSDTPKGKSIFLPTNIVTALKYEGVQGFYLRYKTIFDAGIPIKLPNWPGLGDLTDHLTEKQVEVIPSTYNSFHLIQTHANVITNGIGSTAREAAMAGKNIYIYPDQWTNSIEVNNFASSSLNCFTCTSSTNWNRLPNSKQLPNKLANQELLIREIESLIETS